VELLIATLTLKDGDIDISKLFLLRRMLSLDNTYGLAVSKKILSNRRDAATSNIDGGSIRPLLMWSKGIVETKY